MKCGTAGGAAIAENPPDDHLAVVPSGDFAMLRDPEAVKRALRTRILQGYGPRRTLESCEDFWSDWFALSAAEFEAVKQAALAEKRQMEGKELARPGTASALQA